MLVNGGADVDAKNDEGTTTLWAAEENNWLDAKLILERAASKP